MMFKLALILCMFTFAKGEFRTCITGCGPFYDCGEFQYDVLYGCAKNCLDAEPDRSLDESPWKVLDSAWNERNCIGALFETAVPSCIDECDRFSDCADFQDEFSSTEGCAFDCMRSENAVEFLGVSWDSGPSGSDTCAGNLSYAPTDLPSCFARCNSDLDLIECEQIQYEISDRFGGCMSKCSMSEQNEFWANRCDENLTRCEYNGTLVNTSVCAASGYRIPEIEYTKVVLNETLLNEVCCPDAVARVLEDVTSRDGGVCDTPFGHFNVSTNCNITKYPNCDLNIWLRAKCAVDDDDPYLAVPNNNNAPHLLDPSIEVNGHRVLILECETGYTFVNDTRTDFSCDVYDYSTFERPFHLSDDAYTWSDAKSYCENRGSTLASVHSQSEWEEILAIAKDVAHCRGGDRCGDSSHSTCMWFWLGGKKGSSSWVWIDGTTWDWEPSTKMGGQPAANSEDVFWANGQSYLSGWGTGNSSCYGGIGLSWHDYEDFSKQQAVCRESVHLDRTERCNTISDVCWRSTPCPINSDGESVEKGCTCRTGYLGAVYATSVFPYFEGGCVYDDPDPCNVSSIVLPLGASTNEAFCGDGIEQIESGDVCVPHCDDDYVPNMDFILCQDTQFLDIDTLRCVRKCDAPVNVLRGVSDPCIEGLKIDPSSSSSESFCTLSSRSCETGYEPSVQKLKCENGTLTPSTFECVEMCRAPNPIKYVKAGSTRFESMGASNGGFSCQEGEYISPDSNCTTRCQSGYVPTIDALMCTTDTNGNRVVEPSGFVCNQLVPQECRVENDIPAHCFPPCLTNDATPDDAVGVNTDQGGKCGDSSSNVLAGQSCTSNCDSGYVATVNELKCLAGPTIYSESTFQPSEGYRCIQKCSLPTLSGLGISARISSFEGCGEFDSSFDTTGTLSPGGGYMNRDESCKMNCLQGYEAYNGQSNLFACSNLMDSDYSRFVAWGGGTNDPDYVFRCTEMGCQPQSLLSTIPSDRTMSPKCITVQEDTTTTTTNDDDGYLNPGQECTPNCPTGFGSSVEGNLKCHTGLMYSSAGAQVSIFSCDPLDCDIPILDLISNGNSEGSCADSNATTIEAGSICTAQCAPGYVASVESLNCPISGGGVLVPSTYECSPGPCELDSSTMWRCLDFSTTLEHGQSCVIKCPSGYQPSQNSVSCNTTQLLVEPSCIPDPCPQPLGVLSVSASGPCEGLGENDFVQSGQSCRTQCGEGYVATASELRCNAGVLSPATFKCVGLRSRACLADISDTDSNRRAKMFDFQRHERSEIASAFTCMELCKSYPYFLLHNRGQCECLWNPRAAEILPSSQGCGTFCYADEEAGSNFPCGTSNSSSLYESPAFEFEDIVTSTTLSSTSQYKSYVSLRANYVLAYSSDISSVSDDELRSNVMSPVLSSMIETVMSDNNVDPSYATTYEILSRTLLDPARAVEESRTFSDSSSSITLTADALIAFISGSEQEEIAEYLSNKNFSDTSGLEYKGGDVSVQHNNLEWNLRHVGCWQTGMKLDVETTNAGRFSTVSFSSSAGCSNGMTAECCMNHCVDHVDCTGVTWYSNATCITYDAMRDDDTLGDPPSLVPDDVFHDSQIGLQITASRLKACRHCDILNYKVVGNQISDTSSLSSFSSCSARCKGSVGCKAWNEDTVTDSCVLYDTVTKIVPQVDATNLGFASAGLISEETCSDDESLPIPCELPESVYSTCRDSSHTFTALLPHGSTCIPDCAEGYSSSIQNFTCHQGELVSFPIDEEARCNPNPCTLPVDSGGECTDGTVSSGAFCEVRCLDTELRPNVTRFECFAGSLIANKAVHQSLVSSSPPGVFECNRPCNVAVARCLEGTEIMHSTSCSPLCPDGEIPSEQAMFCDEGVLTPSNFQCKQYIKVGDGTLATFADIISIVNVVQEDIQNSNPTTLPSHLDAFDRECVRQCIGTPNCNAVSRITRDPEESASCMLFSEPATAISLDKYASNSATLNVGERAVDNVANYIAGERPTSSEGEMMTCSTGFVALQAQYDGLENGAACAFARSLSECYEFECPDPDIEPCSQHLDCTVAEASYANAFGSSLSCIRDTCDREWWEECAGCAYVCLYQIDYANNVGGFECTEVTFVSNATECLVSSIALQAEYQINTNCGDEIPIGDSCSFDCAEANYAPQGDGMLDCFEGGILEVETCLPTCDIQGQVPGSHNCGNFLTHDSFCEFQCEDGYVPSNGIEVLHCFNGQLTGGGQRCEYNEGCEGVLSGLNNYSSNLGSHNCSETLVFDSMCLSSCESGYEGSVSVVCDENQVPPLDFSGQCTPHPNRCEGNIVKDRINHASAVVCDDDMTKCTLTSCDGTYVVNSATSIMSCTNKLIEDNDLAVCDEFDPSLVNRPCTSVHSWIEAAVPNSISGTCPDNLSDDETCSFSCANGYTVPEDQAPAQIDCDNSQLIVERGSCVLQSCVLTSTRSDPLEISQQLQGSNVDGIMEIRCLGDMICTVTCDSGYFNEDPDLSMRCGKDSQDQGLLIMESSLPDTFCTPLPCDSSTLFTEHLISKSCSGMVEHDVECSYTCDFGYVAASSVFCKFGSSMGTNAECIHALESMKRTNLIEDVSDLYGNPTLVSITAFVVSEVTSLAHVVWSASEQYRFETKVLETCNSFVARYGSRTRCEYRVIRVVKGSSAEASGAYLSNAVLTFLDEESSSRSQDEYLKIINTVVEYLVTTLSNEFSSTSKTQFMGMSFTSIWLELSTYGRIKTLTEYSEGDDVTELIVQTMNVDRDDVFGSTGGAVVLADVAAYGRRRRLQSEYETTFLATWNTELYSTRVLQIDDTVLDVLSIRTTETEHYEVTFTYAMNAFNVTTHGVSIYFDEIQCINTVLLLAPTSASVGYARCDDTPNFQGVAAVRIRANDATSTPLSLSQAQYISSENPFVTSVGIMLNEPSDQLNLVTVRGENFGVSRNSTTLYISLELSVRMAEINPAFCASQVSSSGTCELNVPSRSISWINTNTITINITDAVLDAGFTETAFYGADVAKVYVTVNQKLALLKATSQIPTINAERPVVTRILNPDVNPDGAYRNQIVTVIGRNFGHTKPTTCDALLATLGSASCALIDVTATEDEGSEIGWVNNTMLKCKVTSGSLDQSVPVRVTREGQTNLNSDILFEYLGDHIPLERDAIREQLQEAQDNGENVRIAFTCAQSQKFTVVDPKGKTVDEMFDNACDDGDAVSQAQIMPAYVIGVHNLTGDSQYCEHDSDGIPVCDSLGSDGENALTLYGENFIAQDGVSLKVVSVEIAGSAVPFEVLDNFRVRIPLPEGTGGNRMVVVSSDDGFTDFSSRLTYKLPVIQALEGCTNSTTDIGRIQDCIIESSNDITIRGQYFGPNSAGVKILVGTTLCENARHEIDDPHNVMYCTMPQGSGNAISGWLPVTAIILNQASEPKPYVRFEACEQGFFWNTTEDQCELCSPGKYTSFGGVSQCVDCPYGKFSNMYGTKECPTCALGRAQSMEGKTDCEMCQPGYYQGNRGQRYCIPCAAGRFAPENETFECTSCEPGTFQSSSSQTECIQCGAGEYASVLSSTVCLNCPRGHYCTQDSPDPIECVTTKREGDYCFASRLTAPMTCTSGMFCPNPVTMRSCGEDQICVAGRGSEPRRCADPNARIESVASQRCICKRGFFGAIQNATRLWQESSLSQSDTVSMSEMRSFVESLWILSHEHATLSETYELREMDFADELDAEFEEYDSNPKDSILSVSEMRSLVYSLHETQTYLQCYACRPGMVCEDPLEALPGLMVNTVEAMPGYWNNNEEFFNSRSENHWGTDLSFERCIGMTRTSSSSDTISSCGGGLSWHECSNEHQTGPMCAVCPNSGGLLDPDYTETLSGRCVDCSSAMQGSTAYLRATVLLVTLLMVVLGVVCFDKFVRMLDGALETGSLAPGSRVARLLRLRRQYKESKKGKRRRSTFSVVTMKKDDATTTMTTTASSAQNQYDGMTTSSNDSTSSRRMTTSSSDSISSGHDRGSLKVDTHTMYGDDNEVSTKDNDDDEDLSPRSRWKKRKEMMMSDDVAQSSPKQKQKEEEATSSVPAWNGGMEGDWLDEGDESDSSADSDDSTLERGAAFGHTKSMRMIGVRKVQKWQRSIENQILEHHKTTTNDDTNTYYFADAPEKPHLWVKLKILISFIQLVIVIQESILVQWPASWLNLIRPLRIFDFDVFSLPYMSCMLNASYWGQFFTQMIAPLIVISCFFLVVPIFKLCSRRRSYDYGVATRYGLIAMVMIYPQNTRLIFESLKCVTISDGKSYLAADFSIECDSSSYASMMYMVYFFLILYTIGSPLLVYYLLSRERKRRMLYNKAGPVNNYGHPLEVVSSTSRRLGVVYAEYHEYAWWMEIALFCFKAAFIVTLVSLKPAVSQVFFILALLVFISYFMVILTEPYFERSDMTVSISCWISLMFISIFAYGAEYDTLNAERGSENLDSFIATALIGATLFPLCVTVFVTLMTWYRSPFSSRLCTCCSATRSDKLMLQDESLRKRLIWLGERLEVVNFNMDCQRMFRKVARQTQLLAVQLSNIDPKLAKMNLLSGEAAERARQVLKKKAIEGDTKRRLKIEINAEGTVILCKLLQETMQHVSAYGLSTGRLAGDLVSLNIARGAVARLLFALAPWDTRETVAGHGCWWWYDTMSTRVDSVTPQAILDLAYALEDVELLLWGLVISKSSSPSSSNSSEVLDVKDQPKRMRELSRKFSRKFGSRASIIPSDAKTDNDDRRRSSVRSNISSFDSFSTADDGIGSDDDDDNDDGGGGL